MTDTTETALVRAERQYEQAKARLQSLRARQATRERKLDTRRKVILGGALVELAARDDRARVMLERLVAGLSREHDRKAFERWQRPGKAQADGASQASPPVETDVREPAGLFGQP